MLTLTRNLIDHLPVNGVDCRCSPRPATRVDHIRVLLVFESIAKGNRFEFDPDGFLDWNNGSCLEYKSRKHRAKLVNSRRIVAVQQHISTPVTHTYHERLDLKIVRRFPLREDLQDPLLSIFVFDR
jgi:hypothetical protein